MISIEINDKHGRATHLHDKIERVVTIVMSKSEQARSEVSVAIVDDTTIEKLNREFLEHDFPTDVLSFNLDGDIGTLVGEVVVSVDTAERVAPEHGWSTDEELLLYVAHGALHLIGYEDSTSEQKKEMRRLEREVLAELGVVVPEFSKEQAAVADGGSIS